MYAVRVWLKNLAVVLWCGHFLIDTAGTQWEGLFLFLPLLEILIPVIPTM